MLKEMTQRAIAVAGWKCMKLLMPVEKTKLPPMMEMMLRYGIATRLWSQARSIMADPAPETTRTRTLRVYSFWGNKGSEKSSENMHKVAVEASQS